MNLPDKKHIPIAAAFLGYLFVQWYGVFFMWYNHPGPLGLEDSAGYMSRIAFFREFPLFDAVRDRLPSHPPYAIHEIAHPYLFGVLALLSGVTTETMFEYNFYIGLFLMGIVLFLLFRKIEGSPQFLVPALLLFAFYEGEGSYHGFSWVVPSFYAILLFLSAVIALFYSRRPALFGTPLIALLLLTHSTGTYLAAVLLATRFFTTLLEGERKKALKEALIFLGLGLLVFLLTESLHDADMLQRSFSSSFKSYRHPAGPDGLSQEMDWSGRISVLLGRVTEIVRSHDFTKYFYGLYTPLLAFGLFRVVKNRQYPLAILFTLLLAGQLAAPLLSRVGYRFFYPLEVVTWIIMAYGFSGTLESLFRKRNETGQGGAPFIRAFPFWLLLALSGLFYYNVVHHKAAHQYHVKFYHPKFFDERTFLDYVDTNREKQFIIFSEHLRSYLYLDGLWRFSGIRPPRKYAAAGLAAEPENHIVIGENPRLYEEHRKGFRVVIPRRSALAIRVEGMRPGRYRLELVDTGMHDTAGLRLKHGNREVSSWKRDSLAIRYPEKNAYPAMLPPWYRNPEKPWPLFPRPFRKNDIVRTSVRHSTELTLDGRTKLLLMRNRGKKTFLHGSIRIVELQTGEMRIIDFDRGEKSVLETETGLLYKGVLHPLLWTDPEIRKPFRNMLFRLEKNFGDVKAFSLYAKKQPKQRKKR